jgi:hypothetical protein
MHRHPWAWQSNGVRELWRSWFLWSSKSKIWGQQIVIAKSLWAWYWRSVDPLFVTSFMLQIAHSKIQMRRALCYLLLLYHRSTLCDILYASNCAFQDSDEKSPVLLASAVSQIRELLEDNFNMWGPVKRIYIVHLKTIAFVEWVLLFPDHLILYLLAADSIHV